MQNTKFALDHSLKQSCKSDAIDETVQTVSMVQAARPNRSGRLVRRRLLPTRGFRRRPIPRTGTMTRCWRHTRRGIVEPGCRSARVRTKQPRAAKDNNNNTGGWGGGEGLG